MTNYPTLKNKIPYIAILLGAAILTTVPFKVYAENASGQDTSEQNSGNNVENRQEDKPSPFQRIKENKPELKQGTQGARQENRCEIRKIRINNRLKMYEISEKFHREKFQNLHERLSNLIEKLDTQGVNTSKLKADLAILKTKLDQLETQYKALTDKLNALKDQTCDATTETNKGQLTEIKNLFEDLKQTVSDIRSFFSNTIRPDLRDLKQKLEGTKSGTTEPGESNE